MRLFVAIETGPDIAGGVGPVVAELKQRMTRMAPAVRVSWTPPERVHLTLRLIGEVDEAKAATIRQALERGVPLLPFPVEIGGLSAFPERGPIRVLWVGLTAGQAALGALERHVSERLAQVGVPPTREVFRPHVTVGRVRSPADVRTSQLFQGIEDVTLGPLNVIGYTLFESRSTPSGVEYVPLVRTRLACQPV